MGEERMVQAVVMQSPELGLLEMRYDLFHRQWTQVLGYDPKEAAQRFYSGVIPFSPTVANILESIMQGEQTVASAASETNAVVKAVAAKKAAMPKKADPKKPSKAVVTDGAGKPKAGSKKVKGTEAAAEFFEPKGTKEKVQQMEVAANAKVAKGVKRTAAAAPAKKAAAKKAPKEAAAKKERAPREDLSGKFIHFKKGKDVEAKRFQEGSARARVYAMITDGMTVKQLIAKVTKKHEDISEALALDCIKKLAATVGQKVTTISLSDK
jgi:hypothetical protein